MVIILEDQLLSYLFGTYKKLTVKVILFDRFYWSNIPLSLFKLLSLAFGNTMKSSIEIFGWINICKYNNFFRLKIRANTEVGVEVFYVIFSQKVCILCNDYKEL